MKARLIVSVLASIVGWALAASAHHGWPTLYRTDQAAVVNGKVIEIVLRNPHSSLVAEVAGADGKTVRWGVEFPQPLAQLVRTGVGAPTSLMVGDRVILTGSPGRDPGDHRLLLQRIVRPSDGWTWDFPASN